MRKNLIFILTIFFPLVAHSQHKMRPVEELVNSSDSGWKELKKWIGSAKNKVEAQPVDSANAKEVLFKIQVTTRSSMGSIIYHTGGLLVDDGWIRILGSGSPKLNRTLADWNKGKTIEEYGNPSPYLLIADDAIGGFFLLNGGGLGSDLGKIYYFSPDNLQYEPLDLSYTQFLLFCFNNDMNKFYEGKRWHRWREEVAALEGNKVISFYPFLWSKEGKNINKITKKVIPVEEQYNFNLEKRKQLGLD